MNAVPTHAEQDEQAQHSDSTSRVLDIVARHVELVLLVAFGVLVLIAVGMALATRSGGPAPSAPAATSSARTSSAQSAPPAPSAPAAPPVPTPRSSSAPQTAPPAAASAKPQPAPAPQTAPSAAASATPAPKPATPAPAPAAKAPTSHTVVAGDTLAGIGLRYQVGFEQIAAANAVADPRLLRAGQQLRIPERAAGTIVIAPGDTLVELAQRAGTSVEALRAVNPQITNPNRITAGGQLRLPRP